MPAEHAYVPDMPQLMTAEELLYTNVYTGTPPLTRYQRVIVFVTR